MKVIGVMSGSSLDGLDIALIEVRTRQSSLPGEAGNERPFIDWELLQAQTVELPPALKKQLQEAIHQVPADLIQTESDFSIFVAESILNFKTDHGVKEVSIVGIHGHTLIHKPLLSRSWQLLNGGMVAEKIDTPVACDFRNQDMSRDGQGTPMAVLADRDLFLGHKYYVNLGGIANVSICSDMGWSAFDLCPCNQLLDHYAKKLGSNYDAGGQLAAVGKVIPALLESLIAHPYIQQAPPKSLDNGYARQIINDIKTAFSEQSEHDILRTLVEYVVYNITEHTEDSATESTLIVTGGGTFNSFLVQRLNKELKTKNVSLYIPEEDIINYKEAILIGYAAHLRKTSTPNFVSSATGASRDVIGGAIYLPSPSPRG